MLAFFLLACRPATLPASDPVDVGEVLDTDGDGIPDSVEGDGDTDGDGIPDFEDTDSDGDGIDDATEAGTDGDTGIGSDPVDTDGDGIPDYLDEDSDGDGIDDATEAGDGGGPVDTDGDGVADHLDEDSDGDGISDADEAGTSDGGAPADTDGDGVADYLDSDSDGDGIDDATEAGTSDDGAPVDSDGDGVADYLDEDSDGDGISDAVEIGSSDDGEPVDSDGDGVADHLDTDSDGDGIADIDEAGSSDGGTPVDTDGDGVADYLDEDSDGDGIADADEAGTSDGGAPADTDGDGVADYLDTDSDGDGASDLAESVAGTDPLDGDETPLVVELSEGATAELDLTWVLAVEEVDVAFLLDTTCSMGGEVSSVTNSFRDLVDELSATVPSIAFGVATFDDYAYASYGYASSHDKPFLMRHQVSTHYTSVYDELGRITLHNGGDGPEASFEALFQAASGDGYDQDCDGAYDGDTDVPPFIARASDAFDGTEAGTYDSSVRGTGDVGGLGFRDTSLPVVVVATDNMMRDPDIGFPSPGGCPMDAGSEAAVDAMAEIGGRFVGIDSGGLAAGQMLQYAEDTWSYVDLDGEGVSNDPLVFTWDSDTTETMGEIVSTAVHALLDTVLFATVTLDAEGPTGMLASTSPDSYEELSFVAGAAEVEFTVTLEGVTPAEDREVCELVVLRALGDGRVWLGANDVVVCVPPTGR